MFLEYGFPLFDQRLVHVGRLQVETTYGAVASTPVGIGLYVVVPRSVAIPD